MGCPPGKNQPLRDSSIMATLTELRKEAKSQYQGGKGNKALKGYSRMPKSKLLSALGRSEEARGQASARSLSKRIASAAGSVAGDSEAKNAALKGRILRNVKREVDAARKKNPDISQEELRKVAARALGSELKAVKEGKAERNLRKEAAQKRKGEGQKEAPKTPGTVTPLKVSTDLKYAPPEGVTPDQIPSTKPPAVYIETDGAGRKNAKHWAKAYGLPEDYYVPTGKSGVTDPGVTVNPDYVSPRTRMLQEDYEKVIRNFNETRHTQPARQRLQESQKADILAVRRGEKPGLVEESKTTKTPSKKNNQPTVTSDADADRIRAETFDTAEQLKRYDKGNRFASAIDRMDASPSYAKPTKEMMVDASGSGFVVTARDMARMKQAYDAVPKSQHDTIAQLEALGQYKLRQMWENATPEMRAAAVKAHGKPDELAAMGFSVDAPKTNQKAIDSTSQTSNNKDNTSRNNEVMNATKKNSASDSKNKFTNGSISLVVHRKADNVTGTQNVPAKILGNFAVHKSHDDTQNEYVVSHVGTGLAVGKIGRIGPKGAKLSDKEMEQRALDLAKDLHKNVKDSDFTDRSKMSKSFTESAAPIIKKHTEAAKTQIKIGDEIPEGFSKKLALDSDMGKKVKSHLTTALNQIKNYSGIADRARIEKALTEAHSYSNFVDWGESNLAKQSVEAVDHYVKKIMNKVDAEQKKKWDAEKAIKSAAELAVKTKERANATVGPKGSADYKGRYMRNVKVMVGDKAHFESLNHYNYDGSVKTEDQLKDEAIANIKRKLGIERLH